MSSFPIDLSHIKAVLFDVDGVLSKVTTALDPMGHPARTVNVRDGYGIREAIKRGITIGIISGGYSDSIPKRYASLGVEHIYMGASLKIEALEDFLKKTGLKPEVCLFVGDDIPDIPVMKYCGFSVAPKDAAHEVKAIAQHILPVKGGHGVARAVLETILRMKGLWMCDEHAFGW
ncbi:KdsC family phosphatase [Porphyromonas levii]|uniref:3-deoxy-D-manno-octulosonate 8-phosphate phosphatase KdsC n=1 Tax=Porphyromonas levii TaxID=28114 RepID=A0A4Y8WP35_9PORP|nr:HAD hydrolase family protein [Porphyromonas levii]MBR8702684.1 3-deoxy-D-manno-octulosonate 8-phosphate phosphatase KdsC [Porphyromonas levii]MBR8712746.1 3-deoxy-D-manno-octulosonate 8-phosphate phosphatase KdsC [Porphyromonas levii]MBR8714757.1 3-deoxy-D-manno-octulosonate 8-phosphate phosphatase KdsC [Porphyromonas levii]MBR8727279.1 3-deoxy-D-manno-octulosonate 8-phosphate phosphatase KdsC [Porphyromonas levii]MBR8728970.1 3-deoxy-D-manno-octulosonate 8-phosphate phosphatase KdsC [Porph